MDVHLLSEHWEEWGDDGLSLIEALFRWIELYCLSWGASLFQPIIQNVSKMSFRHIIQQNSSWMFNHRGKYCHSSSNILENGCRDFFMIFFIYVYVYIYEPRNLFLLIWVHIILILQETKIKYLSEWYLNTAKKVFYIKNINIPK